MMAEALKALKEDIDHFDRKGKGHLIKRAMTNTFVKMDEAFGDQNTLMNSIFAKSNWKNRQGVFVITLIKYMLEANPQDVDVRNFCVKHGHADMLPKKPKQAVVQHRGHHPPPPPLPNDDIYEIEEKRVEITRTVRRVGKGKDIENMSSNVTRLPRRGD